MIKFIISLTILFIFLTNPCFSQCFNDELHVVLIAGQSNIGILPIAYFLEDINKEVGTNHTIIIKHALGGIPISAWDQNLNGWFYDGMLNKVLAALEEYEGREITSITLVWGHGESDVLLGTVDSYLQSFDNLLYQLKRDLNYEDINLVISRLNDWGVTDSWYELREIQEFIGDTYPLAVWIDTDDLNGPFNDMHNLFGIKILVGRYSTVILNNICNYR